MKKKSIEKILKYFSMMENEELFKLRKIEISSNKLTLVQKDWSNKISIVRERG